MIAANFIEQLLGEICTTFFVILLFITFALRKLFRAGGSKTSPKPVAGNVLSTSRPQPDMDDSQADLDPIEEDAYRMFRCPACQRKLQMKIELVRPKMKCPHCRSIFRTPPGWQFDE